MPKFIDYSGKKIGRVSILSLEWKVVGGTGWSCKCDCGYEFTCWSANFKRGDKFECVKCIAERRRGVDLTGRKFGRWTVLSRIIKDDGKTAYNVKCDCGNIGQVAPYSLGRKGRSMSCGCLGRKQRSKYVNETLYPPSHKISLSRLYAIRVRIVHSCYKKEHPTYSRYGGRGFTVCELWRNGAKDFYNWALSNGWSARKVVHIHEGEKEFNPENCYVISREDFQKRFLGKKLEYKGQIKTCEDWAKEVGFNRKTLLDRINKGYTPEEVLFCKRNEKSGKRREWPDKEMKELYENGMSLSDIGRELDIGYSSVSKRLNLMGISTKDWKGRRVYKKKNCVSCQKEFQPINSTAAKCDECRKTTRCEK